jgi:hypothetical protein
MNIWKIHILAVFLVALVLGTGCSGIKPYDPPNDKEEPPGSGLLTGEDGKIVIHVNRDEKESVRVEIEEEAGSGDKKP